jgi:tetratricopeptide (TPR) repeat protein
LKRPAYYIRKISNLLRGNPLKVAGLEGLFLVIVLVCTLLFFTLSRNELIFPIKISGNFARELIKYDEALALERPEALERRLVILENQARSQEEWLSLLKRRRNLARLDALFVSGYQKSGSAAVKAFPNSEAIIAVAGESLLYTPKANAGQLNEYADKLVQSRFAPLVFSIYALTGLLGDPETTANINGIDYLLSLELPPELKDLFRINAILLNILKGENSAASAGINGLLEANPYSRNFLALGGEYFYDYGNPLRAAELFFRLGDSYIGRIADALALAGEVQAARNIWTALANATGNAPELTIQSLYNLASTSDSQQEAIAWLEKIFTSNTLNNEPDKLYGIIRYTRLQNTSRSIAFLEGQNTMDEPLLDLELLRRRMDLWPLDRTAAETWLLLGRHPYSQALYQWAAWFFDRQKFYAETAQLIKIIGQREISAPWVELVRALTLIREGDVNEGLSILEAEYRKNPNGDWCIPANIARVMESKRSISIALDYYERAAALAGSRQSLSLLHLRISRCQEALGRFEESRRSLEYALELDPENFSVRTEIWRLDLSGR